MVPFFLLACLFACRNKAVRAERPEWLTAPEEAPLSSPAWQPEIAADSIRFPFIRFSDNQIIFPAALDPFFTKLRELEEGKRKRVSILHVGDSHIQAGFLSGRIRDLLQIKFGACGRGLVLPFKLAGSHNTLDLLSFSSASWEGRLRTFQKGGPPLGISGSALRTRAAEFSIDLELKPHPALDNRFDRVTLFTDPPADARFWSTPSETSSLPSSPNSFLRSFDLGEAGLALHLDSQPKQGSGSETLLFGILLEHSKRSGILYHAAGLNGATFYHYNHGIKFFEQIPALHPDLVIVSLGTNESLLRPFRKEELRREIVQFLAAIRKVLPESPVLISTQADALYGKKELNIQGPVYRALLTEEARRQGCAVWDLFHIMGGMGSIRQWKQRGLAHYDMVHFTQSGYSQIADLLFTALIGEYERAD